MLLSPELSLQTSSWLFKERCFHLPFTSNPSNLSGRLPGYLPWGIANNNCFWPNFVSLSLYYLRLWTFSFTCCHLDTFLTTVFHSDCGLWLSLGGASPYRFDIQFLEFRKYLAFFTGHALRWPYLYFPHQVVIYGAGSRTAMPSLFQPASLLSECSNFIAVRSSRSHKIKA